MQKVRCQIRVNLQLLLKLTDSGSFHQLTTYFSTFPHGTITLSLIVSYLALEDGSPLFKQVFSHSTLAVSFPIVLPLHWGAPPSPPSPEAPPIKRWGAPPPPLDPFREGKGGGGTVTIELLRFHSKMAASKPTFWLSFRFTFFISLSKF